MMLTHALVMLAVATAATDESLPPDTAMLEALRPFHAVVGKWKGTGTSMTHSGWEESVDVLWGFRDRDGRVSFNFYPTDSELFKLGLLTYDPQTKLFRFIAVDRAEEQMRFDGQADGAQTLKLDRVDTGYKDKYDRLELKITKGGDKLMFTLSTRRGKSSAYTHRAQTELFREGRSIEEFRNGPWCVVTGGAGRVEFEHEQATVHAACENCRKEYLAHPERYLKAD